MYANLKKALHVLKQAPKAWANTMRNFLKSIGCEINKANHFLCVYYIGCGLIVIVIYVVDLIITRSNKNKIVDVKKVLEVESDMKELGKLKCFLVIEVVQMPQGILLTPTSECI